MRLAWIALVCLFVSFSFPFATLGAASTPSVSNTAPLLKWPTDIGIERVEKGTVYFGWEATGTEPSDEEQAALEAKRAQTPLPEPLKTGLYGVQGFGLMFPRDGSKPFVVLEGARTEGPGAEKLIYLMRVDGSYQESFVYPGKVRDRRTNRLLFDGRAFFGECLPNRSVYLIFQKEKLDRRRYLQHSVYVAEANTDGISGKIIVRRRPGLKHVLRRVRKKQCVEINGKNRKTVEFSLRSVHTLEPNDTKKN